MSAALFWILAVLAIATAVIVVAHRAVSTALAAAIVMTLALAGLYLQLDAPWLAAALIVVQGTAVAVAALPVWRERARRAGAEPGAGRELAVGGLLALALIVEVAWALQRLRAAPFPPRPAGAGPGPVEPGAAMLHGDDLMLPVLGLVFVLMSLAAVQASRREGR